MALDEDTITAQLEVLAVHRRTLAHLLAQAAAYGGEVFAPPATANGIAQARAEIARIKAALRAGRVFVEDEPGDEVPPLIEPLPSQRAVGGIIIGDKVSVGTISNSPIVAVGAGAQTTADIYYWAPVTPLDRQQQRNRRVMLDKCENFWIKGVLDQSLYQIAHLELGLEHNLEHVRHPWDGVLRRAATQQAIPAGTPMIKLFDDLNGKLLILGAPGSGKTTLLLELARDLIMRARSDTQQPVPLVFNLSTWAGKRQSLDQWIADELNQRYDMPAKLAQEWVATNAILPLLDGLDEVKTEYREACIEAINEYRRARGFVPLVVCSRVGEYTTLTAKLHLDGAVVIQPLTEEQLTTYAESMAFAWMRDLLHKDRVIGELLTTPLMLSIVVLAHLGRSSAPLRVVETLEERRRRLFDDYIAAMFTRTGRSLGFGEDTRRQTIHWLSYLAYQMVQQGQIIFLIEQLQPEWLPSESARRWYNVLDRGSSVLVGGLIYGLIYWFGSCLVNGLGGGLVGGLIFGLAYGLGASLFGGTNDIETLQHRSITRVVLDALHGGLGFGLVVGLVFGWSFGLVTGLFIGLVGGFGGGMGAIVLGPPSLQPRKVIVIERLQWSWQMLPKTLMSALAYGLVIGLIVGLIYGLAYGIVVGLVVGLVGGLGGGSVGGLRSGPLSTAMHPYQGIARSVRSTLFGGLIVALSCGLIVGLVIGLLAALAGGLGSGIAVGSLVALIVGFGGMVCGGLAFGGYACLSHLSLRLVLSHSGSLPLRLVPFLDSCVERIFLHKIGGGYIFVHRLLMEHFASLHAEQPER